MNVIILAAGYATRLYPLTRDVPKPLLEIGGQTILDRLVNQIERALPGAEIRIVTNRRFAARFHDWARQRRGTPLRILDDGTTDPENRLGAIGDLAFALRHSDGANDVLVSAADNLFEFDFAEFVAAFQRAPGVWIGVHRVEDPERRRRTGIAELDATGRVIGFQEKPSAPRSPWGVPPLYVLDAQAARLVGEYLASGGSRDALGHFLEWLYPRVPVHAWPIRGAVHDIGTLESLSACRARYAANGRAILAPETGGQTHRKNSGGE
jgi:glucose-1-phosphate thymidylyltransferase